MSNKRNLLAAAMQDQYLSVEELDPTIDSDVSVTDPLSDEAEAVVEEDSEALAQLGELQEVNQMATERFGGSYHGACIIAATLESMGFEVDADPNDLVNFQDQVNTALEGAIADLGKRLRTRFQNFREVFRRDRKMVDAMRQNTATIQSAVRNEPIQSFVAPGIAANVLIGSRFDDQMISKVAASIKVMDKISQYVASEIATCNKILALAKSGSSLTGTEIASILKGHLVRERLPELKSTVFPGNFVLSNARGALPEWKPVTGSGMEWLMVASDGKNRFVATRLKRLKTVTERVLISTSTQNKILALSKALEGSNRLAGNACDEVVDAINGIDEAFIKYDTFRRSFVTERNSYTTENGIIQQYLDSLWHMSYFVWARTMRISLGLRQLMTIK